MSPPRIPSAKKADARAERLAAELRANLARRKAQTRARRTGEADARPDGIGTVDGKAGEGTTRDPAAER